MISKIILLSQKGVYTYEDMDDWEKSNKIPLRGKDDFHSSLNIKYISSEEFRREFF